jgi:hypothetical protein
VIAIGKIKKSKIIFPPRMRDTTRGEDKTYNLAFEFLTHDMLVVGELFHHLCIPG